MSVIIAAYNRSGMLRHAIESVRNSTFDEWELLVIGDYCTDDSEAVALSFGDPRIRFVNLPENTGGQSAPNNAGAELAGGEFIAFLNQDDLYLPEHLGRGVDHLRRSGADFAWTAAASLLPASQEQLTAGDWTCDVIGVPPRTVFEPVVFLVASTWIMRRETCRKVGPWKPADRVFTTPSQDWLLRASKSGIRMEFIPNITVLVIFSGARKGSYNLASFPEHEFFSKQILSSPQFREDLFHRCAVNQCRKYNHHYWFDPVPMRLGRVVVRAVQRTAERMGSHPHAPASFLRFGWRGGRVRYLRRKVGLDPLD